MENWKDVAGYEGYYQININGDVRSVDRIKDSGMGRQHFKSGRILKPATGSHGYRAVALCKDKKQTSTCIHRILAVAFIPNPNKFRCINHKDGNKLNNNIDNLEWVSHGVNNKHAYDSGLKKPYRKLSTSQVSEIRTLHSNGTKNASIARLYLVNHATISEIVNLKTRLNG